MRRKEMGDLRCALLGSFVAFAVAVPARAGDVYVIEYSQGKKPVIVKRIVSRPRTY
jgi:hypothetical protein